MVLASVDSPACCSQSHWHIRAGSGLPMKGNDTRNCSARFTFVMCTHQQGNERNHMKTRIVTIAAFMMGCVTLASGCNHNRGCVGGSCSGGSYAGSNYGATASPPVNYPSGGPSSGPSSGPSTGSYSEQETYAPSGSGGSGTRSAPVFQGSGSR